MASSTARLQHDGAQGDADTCMDLCYPSERKNNNEDSRKKKPKELNSIQSQISMLKNKGGSRDWREYHIRTYQPLHHVKFLRMQRNRGGSLTRDRAGIKSTSISSLSILISYEVKKNFKKLVVRV